MRRAAKVDSNHSEIVKALREIGCSVASTHMVGKGFPDLTVGYRGRNVFLEVKDGSLSPSARKLTKDEKTWHAKWGGQVTIVGSPEEAQLAVLREVKA